MGAHLWILIVLLLISSALFCTTLCEQYDQLEPIHLGHHSIHPTKDDNLMTYLQAFHKGELNTDTNVHQLLNNRKTVNNALKQLQLMIQLKDHSHLEAVEKILGQKIDRNVIPPHTYVVLCK